VVTPLCVLRRVDGLLTVESVHPYSSPDEVRAATGFPLSVDAATPVTPPPTAQEIASLRVVDPGGVVAVELLSR
jgi:glutaconate CoA-transferase subunit B